MEQKKIPFFKKLKNAIEIYTKKELNKTIEDFE